MFSPSYSDCDDTSRAGEGVGLTAGPGVEQGLEEHSAGVSEDLVEAGDVCPGVDEVEDVVHLLLAIVTALKVLLDVRRLVDPTLAEGGAPVQR